VQTVDILLRAAIAEKRRVSFTLHGRPRVAEPHDYGIMKGVPTLLFYQTGGESNSAPPRGWRQAKLEEISQLQLLTEEFAGPRPSASDRHMRWDKLFATVYPRK
jgi:hypothetical protein